MIQAGEIDQRLISQNQLIQRYIRRHRQPTRLCLSNQGRAACAGQLAEVRAHAALLHQQQVAGQRHGLGCFRNARQAQKCCRRAIMGQTAFGQIMILRVENHGQVEGGGVFQRPAQRTGIAETAQAVAERHAACVAQGDQFGQLLAFQALAQCANREHLAETGFTGTVQNQFGHRRGVEHRFGLWRAAQAGHAACDRSAGFTGDAAFTAIARLAQGHVEVNQAGRCHQPGSVDDLSGFETGRCGTDCDEFACFDMQVGGLIQPAGRVDDASAEDAELHWAFSCSNWRCAFCPLMAIDSTAMRIAMP